MRKGLKDTASVSLEAKAALVGAMYALERLFSASGQRGTDLTNLNSVLGVSTKTLQQYEYAARQVGVSNQEVEGSFKALQGAMTKTLLGEGAPKGLARVSLLTGGITAQDLDRFAKQPQLLIQKLQEYAQKETNSGLKNEVLKSFGLSDNMIAALNRMAFRPEVMNKAPTYGDGEVKALDKANIAWSNLGNKIEMAVGHFNAKHGGELVKDISMITDKVIKLAEAFEKLSEKAHLFEAIGKMFQGWEIIIKGFISLIDSFDQTMDQEGSSALGVNIGKEKPGDDKKDAALPNAVTALMSIVTDLIDSSLTDKIHDVMNTKIHIHKGEDGIPRIRIGEGAPSVSPSAVPVPPPLPGGPKGPAQNVEVNQTLNFSHDGTDPKKTADSTKKAVRDAYRQLSAQGQGS